MKVAGIIAEYNPLHNGHAYHIKTTKEQTDADYLIVALSGDFIQRGEPACLSKHHRAHMALLAGADLVFEIPSTHACQSAELYARSGVELLIGLGCVDALSFGSESGDISQFLSLGKLLAKEPPEYQQLLRKNLKTGNSYPLARQKALESLGYADASWLATPNNILGIEYCKAIFRQHSTMQPTTLKRAGSGYHELEISQNEQDYPSASGIRCHFQQNHSFEQLQHSFPSSVYQYLCRGNITNEFLTSEDFSLLFRWMLFSKQEEKLKNIMDITPELAKRIINERNHYNSYSQFVSLLKTREVTHSRLTRALFHALLDIQECPHLPYARLLGFHKSASCVLKTIKKEGTLPLLTKLADASSLLDTSERMVLEQNTRISNLYESVLCEKVKKQFTHEYQKELIILP